MKIQIASDLHLERMTPKFPGYRAIEPADADLLVIAGDIHHGAEAVDAFADWPVPVIYVHGNHEAYHGQYPQVVSDIRRRAHAGHAVRHLECEVFIAGSVRVLGCCLWTDYALQQEGVPPLTLEAAMEQAGNILFDHRMIAMPDGLFTPRHALQLHLESRAWLERQLAQAFDGKTVVVTHHGVHPHSIHARFAGSPLNPGFISDLTPLLAQADVWIHGHVHDSFDYIAAGCRVVTNPRGYALNLKQAQSLQEIVWENPAFDPQLVIEV